MCIYIRISIYVSIYLYLFMHECTYICIYIHMFIYLCMYVCMYICMFIYFSISQVGAPLRTTTLALIAMFTALSWDLRTNVLWYQVKFFYILIYIDADID